jgi:hypothetical protein
MYFERCGERPNLPDGLGNYDGCVRDLAFALVLESTGVEYDDGAFEAVRDRVAAAREYLGVSPDAVQRVLEMYEPSLAPEGDDWLKIVADQKARESLAS